MTTSHPLYRYQCSVLVLDRRGDGHHSLYFQDAESPEIARESIRRDVEMNWKSTSSFINIGTPTAVSIVGEEVKE